MQIGSLDFNVICDSKRVILQFAEIILPLSLPRSLTYGVPEKLQHQLKVGMRVEVSLGKNKQYAGLVWALHSDRPDAYRVKPVKKILDDAPIISDIQQKFWTWLAAYYCCNLGDVMQAALPAHLKLMNESVLAWDEACIEIPSHLSDEGYLLAEALEIKKKLTIAEIRMLAGDKNHSKAIHEVLEAGVAIIQDTLEEKYREKTIRTAHLNPDYAANDRLLQDVFASLEKAPKQLHMLLTFFHLRQQQNDVAVKDLLHESQGTNAQLQALVSKNILFVEAQKVGHLPPVPDAPKEALNLSPAQQHAFAELKEQWESHPVVLLHGVTGSGKTLLYLKLIDEALQQDKQVLLLLPEIALTTQIVTRVRQYFGGEVGVYHSRFSNHERVEIWQKVLTGEYKVILGARSAIWLPFNNLSHVIIDEEHDSSFKQHDPAPRFHARDAAIYLAQLHGARTLLGSATPSMESAYNAHQKKYGMVSLKTRFRDMAMPHVKIVPAQHTRPALSAVLTTHLLEAMQVAFEAGKQVILFQNKRGYAPFLLCAVCGTVPQCSNCDVSLTYHKSGDKLQCHYCGYKAAPIKFCPKCGSSHIVSKSYGTEKIEEELQRIFPKRKTARMDLDSMRGKNKHQRLIEDFSRGRLDILVGTQMVVKGLDFDNVGLVGVLSADSLLSYPDFRVNERSFQLMEQVSGRSGRGDGQGEVIIQSFNQKHPVFSFVIHHDFRSFYQFELAARHAFDYPPFFRLIKLTVRHRDQQKAGEAAQQLSHAIQQRLPDISVHGPAPALVARVRSYYVFEIWLKIQPVASVLAATKRALPESIQTLTTRKGGSALQIVIDVDPL